MFVNSPRKLAQLALAAVVFYIVVSVVLYVCLEAVEDDMNATGEFGAAFPSRTVLDNVRPWIPWEDGAGRKQFKMVPIAPKGFQREKYNRGGGAERSSGSISVRAEFEKRFPPGDLDRIRKSVEGLRVRSPDSQPSMPYDVYDCPDTPPAGYPMTWKLARQILKDWNPKDTEIPTQIYQGLCVFDWDRDRSKAEAYRAAEVPFVVQNSPEILRASERWNSGGYLQKLVGKAPQRTEHSATAHLMYWKPHPRDRAPPGWTPPSENIEMTIDEFLKRAQEMEDDVHDQLNREHWYFRLNGSYRGKNSYLYDELPIFVPGDEPTFYMIDPGEARGINCRLGMRGNMAIAHYDSSLNWIVVLGGQRRYILAHPDQCKNLELYHFGHPSARHSSIDWTNPPRDDARPFANAMASEVVLQPDVNFQCNARSGVTLDSREIVRQCELDVPKAVY